jgi:uncharacterized protein involved in outer membrane biogenesis
MLARLFVLVGGLVVVALSAALVAPYFIDWTNYRADFEREASAILGRPVTVRGAAEARLLPFPSVSFSDVSVGGEAGAPAMTVETFSMDAELAPFMSGEFRIFDMRLVRPKATVAVAEDGTTDWMLRPSAPSAVRSIAIEKLTVTEGEVTIVHRAGAREHVLSEINAVVSARSLGGPWRVEGGLRFDGRAVALSVSTGAVSEDGSMRLRIHAEPAAQPVLVDADGSVRLEKGAPRYGGQFRITERQVARAAKPQGAPPAMPGPRVSGRFALDHRQLAVESFLLETGPLDNPYSAEGKGLIEFGAEPRFSLTADGAQVRFNEPAGAGGGGLSFAERMRLLEDALLRLPKPGIPGTVEVSLPAVVTGDTTIRDLRLSARPTPQGWAVDRFTAALPGRTTLEASGRLDNETALTFSGSLLLAVGQPSGFAAWVARDVDEAIRRLPAAGFRADVEFGERVQIFRNLELGLGPATFRGEAEARQPADARPSARLALEGGALDMDGLAAFASLFVDGRGAARLAGGDLDLSVKAGPVSGAGLSAGTVDAALRLREGSVDIDRLAVGDLAGASISATGKVSGLPASPAGRLDATVLAGDLEPLAQALSRGFPGNAILQGLERRAAARAGLLADARIDIVANAVARGGNSEITVEAEGTAGGTRFAATLGGAGDPSSPATARLSLMLSGRNEDASALLALYGLPTLPLGLLGAGETDISLEGGLSAMAASASLRSGEFAATFQGDAGITDGKATARGKASVSAPDIEPWLTTTGVALPTFGLGLPLDLSADLGFANGVLTLDGLDGTVNEGAVAGRLDVAFADGLPKIGGELAVDILDLEPWLAVTLGPPALESDGGAWPQTPFRQDGAAPFVASLRLSAATLSLGVFDEALDAKASVALTGEGIRIADLSADYHGGRIAGMAELKNNQGTALLSSQFKAQGVDIVSLLGDRGLSGRADVTGSLSASGKSVGALIAALAGSGAVSVPALAVDGLNADAFAPIIARADAIGRDIDEQKTAQFAPALAGSGRFPAAPVDAAFTVAGGVLRVPPVRLSAGDKAVAEADLQANLASGAVSIGGAITYAAGNEALVGSEPSIGFAVTGPLDDLEKRFDTVPLAQFLMQRALEIEQARVEAMQSALLEKQRLRREARYYASLRDERAREAERLRLEEERQRREDEERVRRQAEEAARRTAEQARLEEQERAARAAEEAIRRALERPATTPVTPVPAFPMPPEAGPTVPARPGEGSSSSLGNSAVPALNFDGLIRPLRP